MKPSQIQVGKTYRKAGTCGSTVRTVKIIFLPSIGSKLYARNPGQTAVSYQQDRWGGTWQFETYLKTFALWAGSEVTETEAK